MASTHVNERLWQLMRSDETPRTASQLAPLCGGSRRAVEQRLLFWRRDGLVLRDDQRPATFRMSAAAPATPPRYDRTGALIGNREPTVALLWRAMRAVSKRGTFDAPMIAMIAGTSAPYALNYTNRLRRAGYVQLVSRKSGGENARFRLVRDTGRAAPRIDVRPGQRVLIDPNNGARIDISPGRVDLWSKDAPTCADGGVG